MECSAVDEADAVEVDQELQPWWACVSERTLEGGDVRQIELALDGDDDPALVIRLEVGELERGHGRASIRRAVSAGGTTGMPAGPMTESAPMVGSDQFRIDVERPVAGTAVVSVTGDADLHSAPELRDRLGELVDEGTTRVVVDLTETTFVDSMTLGVLLGSMKRLGTAGGRLELVVSRPDIRRIFEITMLDRVFELYPSREQALEAGLHGDAAS